MNLKTDNFYLITKRSTKSKFIVKMLDIHTFENLTGNEATFSPENDLVEGIYRIIPFVFEGII